MSGCSTVQSVRRALEVLEFVCTDTRGFKLSMIAAYMGLGKTAAYKTVQTFVRQGFLERDGRPARYRPTALMSGIRMRQVRWDRAVLLPAMPLITKVARGLHGHVVISQRIGGLVTARLCAIEDREPELQYWHFCPVAPYGSAVLFLAYMDEAERDVYRSRNALSPSDKDYWKSPRVMDRFLSQIRRTGCVAFAKGAILRAATAVLDPCGQMVAMASASKPLVELQPGEAGVLLRASKQIARTLSARLAAQWEQRTDAATPCGEAPIPTP